MLPERWMTQTPDRMIYLMDEPIDLPYAESLSEAAVSAARDRLPKINGNLARSIQPVFGAKFWGIYFPDKIAWYLEQGTKPHTMRSLADKTIPMWVDDPDGSEAKKIGRKAKTRITEDGRSQVLIFRKAAPIGSRKWVIKNGRKVSVPRSYPGAPGRIGNPRSGGGRIASGNSGVRWRHPGIEPRGYLNSAMEDTVEIYGLDRSVLLLIDASTYPTATKS